jgi:hypothetical protein
MRTLEQPSVAVFSLPAANLENPRNPQNLANRDLVLAPVPALVLAPAPVPAQGQEAVRDLGQGRGQGHAPARVPDPGHAADPVLAPDLASPDPNLAPGPDPGQSLDLGRGHGRNLGQGRGPEVGQGQGHRGRSLEGLPLDHQQDREGGVAGSRIGRARCGSRGMGFYC